MFLPRLGTDGLSDDTHHPLQLRTFYGNASLQTYASSFADNISDPIIVNGSIVNNQYPAYYWSGFASYPYGYLGRSTGANFSALKAPIVFNPDTAMSLTLTQTPLIFTYQRQFNVRIPFDVGTANVAEKTTNTEYTTVRRMALSLSIHGYCSHLCCDLLLPGSFILLRTTANGMYRSFMERLLSTFE